MFEEYFHRNGSQLTRRISDAGGFSETTLTCTNTIADARSAWWYAYLRGARVQPVEKTNGALRILDLFSGCGGLGLGVAESAHALGWQPRIELAVDVDREALAVYQHNLGATETLQASVASLVDFEVLGTGPGAEFAYLPELIEPAVERLVGTIDVLCAGPPCQGNSNLNNHSRRDDLRNLLYLTVPAIAAAVQARSVIIENVPDVRRDRHGVVATAISLLEAEGYNVQEAVLSAAELGWPQSRKRYFLIATRGVGLPLAAVASALAAPPEGVTWAIDDLEDEAGDTLFNTPAAINADNIARIDWLFEEGRYELVNDRRPDCHKDGHTYPSVYGRLRPGEPSGTITTGFMTPGRGRYIHPTRRRVITAHEAARIQGFPDWFDFLPATAGEPSRKALSKWIGDAVPPILGYAAGLAAISELSSASLKLPLMASA